jgi:NADP-dependent 3-hydroxy acid dehydrogenase YdfG
MDTSNMEVVVVTGASAGVGRTTAREFGEHGAKVALLARGEDGLEGAKKEVEAAGGVALPIPTDVTDPEQVEAAAQRAEDELGPIDVWVNDAIAVIFSPFKDIDMEDFKRSTEVLPRGGLRNEGRLEAHAPA